MQHDAVIHAAKAGCWKAEQGASPCTHLRTDLLGESMMVIQTRLRKTVQSVLSRPCKEQSKNQPVNPLTGNQGLTGPPGPWGLPPVRVLMLRGPAPCFHAMYWENHEMPGAAPASRGLSPRRISWGPSNPAGNAKALQHRMPELGYWNGGGPSCPT